MYKICSKFTIKVPEQCQGLKHFSRASALEVEQNNAGCGAGNWAK